jgi:hypothetical protein
MDKDNKFTIATIQLFTRCQYDSTFAAFAIDEIGARSQRRFFTSGCGRNSSHPLLQLRKPHDATNSAFPIMTFE